MTIKKWGRIDFIEFSYCYSRKEMYSVLCNVPTVGDFIIFYDRPFIYIAFRL